MLEKEINMTNEELYDKVIKPFQEATVAQLNLIRQEIQNTAKETQDKVELKIENLQIQIDELKKDIKTTTTKVDDLDHKVSCLDIKLTALDTYVRNGTVRKTEDCSKVQQACKKEMEEKIINLEKKTENSLTTIKKWVILIVISAASGAGSSELVSLVKGLFGF